MNKPHRGRRAKDIADTINEQDAMEAGTSGVAMKRQTIESIGDIVMGKQTIESSPSGTNNNALPIKSVEKSGKTHLSKSRGNKPTHVGERDNVEGYDGVEVNVNPLDDNFGDTDNEENDFDDNDSDFLEVVIMLNKNVRPSEEEMKEEVECWKKNPAVREFFWEMFADQFKEREDALIKTVTDKVTNNDQHCMRQSDGEGNSNHRVAQNVNAIKSPSDTTVYKPAFQVSDDSDRVINKISNFVEGIRIESAGSRRPGDLHRVMRTPKDQETIHQGVKDRETTGLTGMIEAITNNRMPKSLVRSW